jgi:hypothetical protein
VRRTFTPRPDDIFVATYPRSGTSLMQATLHHLAPGHQVDFQHIDEVSPFLEKALQAQRSLDELPSPRVFKTHLPCRLVTQWPGRYVYVSRCGRDVLLSYYHFFAAYVDSTIRFESFFKMFLTGNVQYGSWFRHVLEWETLRGSETAHFVRYDQLVTNPQECLESLTLFLGWQPSEAQSQHAIEKTRFSFMQQQEGRFAPPNSRHVPLGSFVRQGKSGIWRGDLSPEQQEEFHAAAVSYFGERLDLCCNACRLAPS